MKKKKNIAIAKIIFPVSLVKCHRIGKRINMQILSGPIYTVFKNTPNKTIKKCLLWGSNSRSRDCESRDSLTE